MKTTAVNIRDWASAFGFALSPAAIGSIDVPCLVVWGQRSHPAARRANALLGASLRVSTALELTGAAHFMIATHAQELAQVIADHVLQVEAMGIGMAPRQARSDPVPPAPCEPGA